MSPRIGVNPLRFGVASAIKRNEQQQEQQGAGLSPKPCCTFSPDFSLN
jgi:hypothetical protein